MLRQLRLPEVKSLHAMVSQRPAAS